MLEKKHILIAPLGLVGLTILSGVFLMSNNVFADDSQTDNVAITVPVACTMTGTGMNSHTATIPNGTYQDNIGTTTMKAVCNDSNGFAIYANGYTGNTLGNNKLIGSSTASEIVTGTNTSGITSNWAMKIETNSGATYALTLDNGFGSYSSVPSTYTKVAHRDSGTDLGTNAEGSTFTSTYAAYISKTQPADSYMGQVIYTLVHPASEEPAQPVACEAGKICYNPNTAIVEGQMGKQNSVNNASITLWAPNFKRTGYGFAGWNDKYDYSGTNYGLNQTITAPADVQTNGLSLYAVWIKSAGSLQNWDGCDSLAQGATTALTDERDGNTYAVAKLADGKCWTIENLRLDNTPELTATNTHNPALPLKNSWYYANQQGTLTTSNHLSATTDPTITAWCERNISSYCKNQSMLATNNTTLFTNNTSTSYSATSNVYSYGNYYNWYSATAGNGTGSVLSGDTGGDICPAGWHLPTSKDSSGDFGLLDIALGGTGSNSSSSTTPTGATMSELWRSYPNNLVYSGSVDGSAVYGHNSGGYYWSSSASDSSTAYILYFASNSVNPSLSHEKNGGRMVRCVADVRQ